MSTGPAHKHPACVRTANHTTMHTTLTRRSHDRFLHKAANLALQVQEKSGTKLVEFLKVLDADFEADVGSLRGEVEAFASAFPMPGPAEGGALP